VYQQHEHTQQPLLSCRGYTGWNAKIAGSDNLFYLFVFIFVIILQLLKEQKMHIVQISKTK
jgi:hypothetical protein